MPYISLRELTSGTPNVKNASICNKRAIVYGIISFAIFFSVVANLVRSLDAYINDDISTFASFLVVTLAVFATMMTSVIQAINYWAAALTLTEDIQRQRRREEVIKNNK